AEQEVAVAARHAPFARPSHRSRNRCGTNHRRDAPAPPREPDGLLSREEGLENQRRVAPLITVAVDCMGGDHGPHVTVPAALEFQVRLPDVDMVLVGLRDALDAELAAHGAAAGPRLRVHHASEVVAMDEPPVQALRYKKDSSMRVAVNLVKSGEAHA